jgi:hypothetical protein
MQELSPNHDPSPRRLLPAWMFSFLFHFGMIAAVVVAVAPYPRGAADVGGSSTGIVLKRAGAEGDLFDGEQGTSGSAATEQEPPTDLMSVLPNEPIVEDPYAAAAREPAPGAATVAASSGPNAGQPGGGGGRRGSPGGGGDANVSVFGVQGKGSKFVYLFDRSSSMEGAPLAAAKRQLLESLASLEGIHQFHVIFFNTKVQSLDIVGGRRRIASATDRNKQLAANFVGGISADGGTDRLSALSEAISFAPDVIFFLTDADDPMSPGELADISEANRRASTAISVIEFGRRTAPAPENFLIKLARETGGQYGYVNTTQLTR